MIQSGASGLIQPDNAPVVLRPFLLVLRQMIQSRALFGLVTALLDHHVLVRVGASLHHHRVLLVAADLLFRGLGLFAAAPHHHGLIHLFTSLPHHGLVLIMVALPRGFVLISAFLRHHCLDLLAASLHHCALMRWSVSPLQHGPCSSMLHCVSSASSSSLYHCISMALSFALLPDMTPSLHHLRLSLLSPSPLAPTFPWMIQSGGLGAPPAWSGPGNPARGVRPHFSGQSSPAASGRSFLFCAGSSSPGYQPATCPRMIQSGVRRLLPCYPPLVTQSGASGRRLSPDDAICAAAALAACCVAGDSV